MSIYHPYEHVKPIRQETADEFNKFYWIGRWCDAVRARSVEGHKLAAAKMSRDPIKIGAHTDEWNRLDALVTEAFENARHFGALI